MPFLQTFVNVPELCQAEPMLPASIGPVHVQFWHTHGMFTKNRFTITYLMTYPAKIISFDNDIFDDHLHIRLMIRTTTCLNTLSTLDGPIVILIFHYWLWKCIESPWLHVTLVLVSRNILNSHFFSFEPMLIRLKIVGGARYTCECETCVLLS